MPLDFTKLCQDIDRIKHTQGSRFRPSVVEDLIAQNIGTNRPLFEWESNQVDKAFAQHNYKPNPKVKGGYINKTDF
jgi:hypothetical protein